MGTTLWVIGKATMADGDDYDHSALFNAAERLDALCQQLGVEKLSTFIDWTDYSANISEEFDFPGADGFGTEVSWFPPDDALPTLRALRSSLAEDEAAREALFEPSLRHLSDEILEELDDCIMKLEGIRAAGDVFHLSAVM